MSTLTVETREPATAASQSIAIEEQPLELRSDITVDELEQLALANAAELYNGRVVFKMPNFIHGVIQINFGEKLKRYLETHPIGLASSDANFRLWPERAKESRAPDISFILKERLPKDLNRFLPIAPDLAIEILSPDDSFMRVMEKVDEYLQRGVKLIWVVIASTREVLVCTKESKSIVRDKLTAPDLLPDFELAIKDIFEGVEVHQAA